MLHPRIAIFNDTHGWHSEQLVHAFNKLNIDVILTDLAECQISLDSPFGLNIPQFEQQLPDAVMVRGIAPGSFEQITLRMDVLHTLAELGVPVFNSAKIIEYTVDKARTSLKLHLAGINTPKTWACENSQSAKQIIQAQLNLGEQVVIKPLFGCQGKGIAKISTIEQFEQYDVIGEAYYLQQYIAPATDQNWQDWRLFVIDGQVQAAMIRQSKHWITNYAQGAQCLASTVSTEMAEIALKATNAIEADYAGVDLIRKQSGEFCVLEVNSVPAWKGLYQATNQNMADQLAVALAKQIYAKSARFANNNVS
jgi:RimK family alpha-L-glutamate ligase